MEWVRIDLISGGTMLLKFDEIVAITYDKKETRVFISGDSEGWLVSEFVEGVEADDVRNFIRERFTI